jgi:8-oxo-dGTP pyrophosphatase MutT (NUDIX family)
VPSTPGRSPGQILAGLLAHYVPGGPAEQADLARTRDLVAATADPWQRSLPLHVTASALIVHPPSGRVLLRWHPRQRAWLQVGGHGDPGESDPLAIAQREGAEETGLPDLVPWPDGQLRHLAIVSVPARGDDPAHEHADLRFLLATAVPQEVVPEAPDAPLRWLPLAQAEVATTEANLRETLARVRPLLLEPR